MVGWPCLELANLLTPGGPPNLGDYFTRTLPTSLFHSHQVYSGRRYPAPNWPPRPRVVAVDNGRLFWPKATWPFRLYTSL